MTGKVTVRRIYRPYLYFGYRTNPNAFHADKVWSIRSDGVRTPYLVVDHRTGMTVVREDAYPRLMLTTWHGGIGPGDLARLVVGQGRFVTSEVAASITLTLEGRA